ncbi:serine/threonine-protein phosphatase CPPED1 isoform X3 [Mycteria americana]|uniref:serine/threonine-protein phosphatase CPPED1 isoform X3 n=1 Tax=Mycteria americana TaxID=33587 RepID=UPI003F58DF98
MAAPGNHPAAPPPLPGPCPRLSPRGAAPSVAARPHSLPTALLRPTSPRAASAARCRASGRASPARAQGPPPAEAVPPPRRPGARRRLSAAAARRAGAMAAEGDVFLRARGRTLTAFRQETQWRKDQEQDLKNVLKNTDQDIPLVFVSGNHDIGNTPTRETIDNYCKNWGDDYFSFWVGGVFFLVLNSQLYFDSSKCPELKQAQDVWLNEQLAVAEKHKCKHIIVFQHIPLFLRKPDEDHDYFNLEKSVRQEIMEKFHKAGVKAVFSGHYHRNAGGSYRGLEMVVSSAIGCQLGEDTHGLRVVVVTDENIVHRYYSLNELSSQGIEKELLDMLAKQN